MHYLFNSLLGRVAAECILAKLDEKPLPIFKTVPYFWYAFRILLVIRNRTVQYGKSIRYVGHATSYDQVYIQVHHHHFYS